MPVMDAAFSSGYPDLFASDPDKPRSLEARLIETELKDILLDFLANHFLGIPLLLT